ncbi:unnamed protein product [Protopolystoma xenopodis]|uniref:Uncharacterized protein n=1 Tax=Protopolystoma xenopodis TaxID=117903 RepID=A0A448WPU8_9PLAT|nr:unnamed protein product [Protopolystoma xenopodis]
MNRFGASPDPKSTGSVTSSLNQDRLAKRLARFGSLTQT